MISVPPAAESAGQPSSSSRSHGIHRRVSGVWEHLVKPAGSHGTAGHQCTRTGKFALFWIILAQTIHFFSIDDLFGGFW